MKAFYPILSVALLASACASLPVAAHSATTAPAPSLASISQDYVRLTLEAGTHKPNMSMLIMALNPYRRRRKPARVRSPNLLRKPAG